MAKPYNRKDKLYQAAKDQGYRSRAAFKLKEIQDRYKVIKPSATVLDLGCWPGGWLQVVSEIVTPPGLGVGIDLVATDSLGKPFIHTITGNALDEHIQAKARELAPQGFDVIISDMSPKLTGIREVDQAQCASVLEIISGYLHHSLRSGGAAIAKVFPSPSTEQWVKELKKIFHEVKRTELDATRSSSNENYVVAMGKK